MLKKTWGVLLVALSVACVDEGREVERDEALADPTSTFSSALITNPTEGGPFDSAGTYYCSNQGTSYCFVLFGSPPLLTATSGIAAFLDNAARNWGCSSVSPLFNQPIVAVTGGFSKQYGVVGNNQACGISYWNNAKQAAYFVPNADRQCGTTSCNAPFPINGTSRNLLVKYAALSGPAGVLGLPVSNPVPYGWEGTTYQLFTNGFITYHSGHGAAYYAGGTGSRKKVADRYLAETRVTPTTGNDLYGLIKDISNTCLVAGQTACTAVDDTGDVAVYFDSYWGGNGYVIARTAGEARVVHAPIYHAWNDNLQPPIYNGGTPWSGSTFEFPWNDLHVWGTGSNLQAVYLQNFENGKAIVWQAKNCPAQLVPSCPSAGPMYCTTYGTRSTNYLATDLSTGITPCILGIAPSLTATERPRGI